MMAFYTININFIKKSPRRPEKLSNNMKDQKKILVAPLDWGIGHATRCVLIIRTLQEFGASVILATSGRSGAFLKREFPDLEQVLIPGYEINYPHNGSMTMRMLRKSPVILSAIRREHRMLEELVDKHKLDAVISDNRFGLWSERIPSIYITHQISIKAPTGWSFTEGLLYMVHRKYIKHYNECWVPDLEEDEGLSGELGHKRQCPVPTFFIGPQSRFDATLPPNADKKYDLMVIISGPEPQRSIFQEMIIEQLKGSNYKALVVLGKPELKEHNVSGNIEVHSHLDTDNMQDAMRSSGLIICRPGYSSIMDIAILGKQAVFVPTPGQTEQEYLAAYHTYKNNYYSISQGNFDINKCIQSSKGYTGLKVSHEYDALAGRIDMLLSQL